MYKIYVQCVPFEKDLSAIITTSIIPRIGDTIPVFFSPFPCVLNA